MNITLIKCLVAGCLLLAGKSALAAPCSVVTTTNLHDFRDVFIPRDAPIGSRIADAFNANTDAFVYDCGQARLDLQMLAAPAPRVNAAYEDNFDAALGQNLYASGVAGIGIAIQHVRGWRCASDGSPAPSFPFLNAIGFVCSSGQQYYYNGYKAYLVKTGNIAPGRHNINGVFYNTSFNGSRWAAGSINARVTVAGCSLPSAPSNQINVPLGSHQRSVFSGAGTGTPAVDFAIALHSCTAGTYPDFGAWNYFSGNYANVRLDPIKGSTILNAASGILSLGNGSSARGIGIQVFSAQGVAVHLGQEVRLDQVQNGSTQVALKARYVQLGPAIPEPGPANGSLSFTVTFR
ncbi:type 1 fimbrial protein [Pseudomonas sp. B21-032]|uniref:fimbrial protein n=1 Tax=Pseudomonas sp. B21-032 TaxID=2895483 RepID=UPI002160F4B3|nr:fimbrial protein [Pseudomonas sp. B21-032]UVL63654.1 type 1 fimbrial protein [Pseudomonas sp. B21-032]